MKKQEQIKNMIETLEQQTKYVKPEYQWQMDEIIKNRHQIQILKWVLSEGD